MRRSRTIFKRPSYTTLTIKKRRPKFPLIAGAGLCLALISIISLAVKYPNWLKQSTSQIQQLSSGKSQDASEATVLSLVSLSPEQRASQLEALTQAEQSLDRSRARYLRAVDLIRINQGQAALKLLAGLEQEYSPLSEYILLKRAQAYESIGDRSQAQSTWLELLKRYPESAVAPEALWALKKTDIKDWEKVLALFPSHPRSLEFIQQQLKANPHQPKLLSIQVKYLADKPGILPVLDRLVINHATELKAEDWEAVAQAYWNQREYKKAAQAYIKAPNTPFNAYRIAKGRQISGQKADAVSSYQFLVTEFPQAKETALGLIELANLSQPQAALPYLDQVIKQFPDKAGDALLKKAEIYEQLNNPQAATQTRQLMLAKYSNAEAVAEYRWNIALKQAQAQNIQAALQWAQPIVEQNPNGKFGPRATFWVGKWSSQLGKQNEAVTAFKNAIARYPQSYYAWRSAVYLGWDVGDFPTVGQYMPEIVPPSARPELPAGTSLLKELYQLGQDADAWTVWQGEFQNKIRPSVAEQYTDGLIQIAIGNYLQGISQVSKLEDRQTPEEQSQYQAFKQQLAYWHALYPLPFIEKIQTASQQYQINPLLVVALMRQESRFQTAVRSSAGAVGLMQIMPATGSWAAKIINLNNYKLDNPKDNIQVGTWYLDHTHKTYKNNSLLAVASYNAGPGNVSKWLLEKGISDPDEFVEAIPFAETNWYVKNVFGNYWNYLRLYNPQVSQLAAQLSN